MYDSVAEAWAEHRAELQAQHDALPELQRPWLASRLALMDSTDMAVVVSQSQNEIAQLERRGLDIRPHRRRMNEENLAERFKAADDPLRIVFVCAMWMVGFDAPSVSTIYLDRPMRNHTLMQTIARANRVFPDKDNGLAAPGCGPARAPPPPGRRRPDRRLRRRIPEPGADPRHLRSGERRARGRQPDPARRRPRRRPGGGHRGGHRHLRLGRGRPAGVAGRPRLRAHRPARHRRRGPAGRRGPAQRVPRHRPPGPEAVQGPAARPGRRCPTADSGRRPGAGRTAPRPGPAPGRRSRRGRRRGRRAARPFGGRRGVT